MEGRRGARTRGLGFLDGFRSARGSVRGLAGLFEARPKRLVPVAYQWPPFSGLGAGFGAGS